MNKALKVSIILLSLIAYTLVFTSCVSKKSKLYFNKDEINQAKVSNSYKTVFKPDDMLEISISARNMESVQPFNLPAVTFGGTSNAVIGAPRQQSFLIDSRGEIDYPILGRIKIAGLSREEAVEMFIKRLDPQYVKKPTVNIRIANYKITVLGDVKNPGVFFIPNERITIIEAMGLAGDLNISASRKDIKVIREVDNQKIEYTVDFLSKKTLTSPVYYLEQNDIVRVDQNYAKVQSAAFNRSVGLFISISSVLISLITVLTR